MKRLLLALFLLTLPGLGQSAAPAAPPKPPAPPVLVSPDEGTLNGQRYTSDYFGFRLTLPGDFQADEDPAGGEEDASHRSFVLLTAFGSGERRGSVMVIMADQAAPAGATDASAYLTKVATPFLQRKGFVRHDLIRRLSLSGHSFAAADFSKDESAQTVLVTMLRGYALNFILMGKTRADVEQMAASLASLQFTPAEKPQPAPASPPAH